MVVVVGRDWERMEESRSGLDDPLVIEASFWKGFVQELTVAVDDAARGYR